MKRLTVFAPAIALMVLACASIVHAQTSTAQSAMFNNTASGNFVITGNEVWSYNKDTAATYFTNTLTSGPDVTCGGSPTNCADDNKPDPPAAPAPDASKLNATVNSNSCNFWEGTELSVSTGQQNYKQSVTINGLNTKGNWTFEWTYTVAVGTTNPPAAQTAWELQSSSTTTADVSVTGFFAGQSTQLASGKGKKDWSFKASHTMTDAGVSRLVDPVAKIYDAGANLVCSLAISTALEYGVDYFYAQNAGSNGPTGQLIDGDTVNRIQNGLKASPNGNVDDFAGNNTTLGERANITGTTPAACSIAAAGSYSLQVSGILKGVSGSASLPVSVTSSVCISAGSCQVCN
jgi:hypothetical protein